MKIKKITALLLKATLTGWFLFFCCTAETQAQAKNKNLQNSEIAGVLYAHIKGENNKIFLPLKRTDVKLQVVAGITTAKVSQTFMNETDSALEAIYVFPLPSKAAVTDMNLKIGNRIISSVIKEKEEAKKTYEAAKAAGKKTALVVQQRPNIFTTSVANFMPGETVEISLTYMEALDYQKGVYTVNFPMVVGQRYIPFRETAPPAESGNVNPPLLHPNIAPQHRLALEATIIGLPVREIISNTHKIYVKASGHQAQNLAVNLAEGVTIPNSDFNMKIYLNETAEPQVSLVNTLKGDDTYGMLTLFPPLSGTLSQFSIPRDVIFLVDTSGSMSGISIKQATAGLRLCMQMLRPEDRFTIVRFSHDYSSFNENPVPADSTAIENAIAYIDGLTADGGTEMQPALQFCLEMPEEEGRMKMIVFLTDGAVGNEDSLLKLLSNHLGRTRLFTFGIGSAPNEYLMRKMAEAGRGQSRFIHSHEDIGKVMADFFNTLESPVMTDISLTWKDSTGNALQKVEYYPNPCPDVFYQRPLQVFFKKPGLASNDIFLSGRLADQTVEFRYSIGNTGEWQLDAVDRMFARQKIDDLMFRRIRSSSYEDQETLKQEIIKVSLDHQVLSKFTGRVAVEEKVTRDPAGKLKKVKVKVPLPKGWDPQKFHPTATNDALVLLMGLASLLAGLLVFIVRRLTR